MVGREASHEEGSVKHSLYISFAIGCAPLLVSHVYRTFVFCKIRSIGLIALSVKHNMVAF